MRSRDLAIVAAVLLIGGFAAADALRGDPEPPAPPAATTGPRTVPDQPAPVVTETVVGVGEEPLEGRLVYTDDRCELRELDLGDGTLLRHGGLRGSCGLVSPARGERVAMSLPSRRRDTVPYRVVDLADPDRDLPTVLARIRSVVWGPDGAQVAWCAPSGQIGYELELGVGFEPRPLRGCPVAYTPSADPVYIEGRSLVADGRALVEVPGRITTVSFGVDRSLAIATPRQLLLYGDAPDGPPGSYGRLEQRRAIPPELQGLRVVFSPTHCHAAFLSSVFPPTPTVFVRDVRSCPGSRAPVTFVGRAAAWSPDGTQLAVAERERVIVYALFPVQPAIVLRVVASDLAWKS
jgi:hypothetical protein